MKKTTLAIGVALATISQATIAQESRDYTDRVVIEFNDSAKKLLSIGQLTQEISILQTLAGRSLEPLFKLGNRFVVLKTDARDDGDLLSIVNRMKSIPGVKNVEPDPRIEVMSATAFNDTNWGYQYGTYSGESARADTFKQFFDFKINDVIFSDQSTQASGVTVSIIDSGVVRNMTDLNAPVFEADFTGGADPYNAQDFNTSGDQHGTTMAGTIAAKRNNNFGTVGILPNAKISQMKVISGNGGSLSSAANAILLSVNRHDKSGVHSITNPEPADVINMSFGTSPGLNCSTFMQDAIDEANNAGAIMVAASGNGSRNGAIGVPAACEGVVSVGSINTYGKASSYSNMSVGLVTSTFGGDTLSQQAFIVAKSTGTGQVSYSVGTSNSTPIVASVIALAKQFVPSLTGPQAIAAIKFSNSKFNPQDTRCGAGQCGGAFNPVAFLNAVGVNLTGGPVVPPTPEPENPPTPNPEPETPPVVTNPNPQPETPPTTETPVTNPNPEPPVANPEPQPEVPTQGENEPRNPVIVQEINTGSEVQNVRNVSIKREDGGALGNSVAYEVNGKLQVNIEADGNYIVQFEADPVTNSNSVQSANVKTYQIMVNRTGNTVTSGDVTDVSNGGTATDIPPGQPSVEQPSSPTTIQEAPSTAGGGDSGGGGSMSLIGLLAMGLLIGLRKKVA